MSHINFREAAANEIVSSYCSFVRCGSRALSEMVLTVKFRAEVPKIDTGGNESSVISDNLIGNDLVANIKATALSSADDAADIWSCVEVDTSSVKTEIVAEGSALENKHDRGAVRSLLVRSDMVAVLFINLCFLLL